MSVESSRGEPNRFSDLDAEFEILRELGRGGTAVVYLARERALDRHVAIKVIRATYVEDDSAAARLIREARTVAQLQHPNIVMLYGTRRLGDGSLALVMQYVSGRTLKDEIRASGALPFDRATQILRDVARALECAHRQRIVHRDIKPENIYLNADTGAAQLSDFGIARPWDTEGSLTLPGMAIGTPAYMAPEQIDGGVLDGRSDIYSLGLVAYEILTGRPPWSGETIYNTIYKQKHEDLPAIDALRPGVPRALLEVVERALHKNPEERWASADALLEALNDTQGKRRGKGKAARSRRRRDAAAALKGEGIATAAEVPTDDLNATIVYRRGGVNGAEPVQPQAAARVPAASAGPPDTPPVPLVGRDLVETQVPPEPGDIPLALESFDRARTFVVAALLAGLVIGTPMLISAGPLANDRASSPAVETAAAPGAIAAVAAATPSMLEGRGTAALAYPLHGERQTGVAGDTLPAPLVLRVEDAAGAPVSHVRVMFSIAEGAGIIVPDRVVTDEHGLATARWLPEVPGTQRIEARAEGTSEVIAFHALVLPRPAAVLSDARADAERAAGARLAVRVDDDRGQPVAGARVRFTVRSGGGRIEPVVAETDAQGLARAQWVHGRSGPQHAEARVQDVDAAGVLVFSAEAETETEVAAARVAIRSGVAVGGTHTCVLDADGAANCWGGNDSGQLGDGGAGRRAGAVRVAAPEPFAAVAAGLSHSCAVGVSGSAFCWGANTSGQLGDGTRVGRGQPVRVQSPITFTRIFAGMSHSCALGRDSRLHCWGDNAHGQLGDGSSSNRDAAVPVAGGRTVRTAAVGWAHTCALAADGRAWCWGRNTAGELGDGSRTDRARPVAVAGGNRFTDIAAGSAHTCGLRSDGVALCWGQNTHGQLGTGGTTASAGPVEVAGPEPFTALTAGGVHSCALGRSGAAYCWGRNIYGQVGDGSTENRPAPVRVATDLRFRALQASGAHTCGRATDGADYCWGYNIEGQLGNGTRNNQSRPSRVARSR